MSWKESLGKNLIKNVEVTIGDNKTTSEMVDGKLKVGHYYKNEILRKEYTPINREELLYQIFNGKTNPLPKPPTKEEMVKYYNNEPTLPIDEKLWDIKPLYLKEK